ncbi:hypothetical protein BDV32DRAFT_152216 [Aspergillus pseudonomiae]|uniref:F-box domain-containing protein n=1 Tax=Aspergillus pseudonomiae TaxID=1506151 RepID=A0A5N6HTP4_9EURO|nr:uncharacterized protein BDV37DRAFT_284232 [Aspergillus pseudonomiae]KAB8257628.1 hypothetical protein BDV32DRAFT_152216 [Aspergillus pseudonomiae]KAE8402906.1 hypothetical protein BDV37DRAFT_284232 [Aspergillus pseudonomiae]
MAAPAKVLSTFELLELILLQLDTQTLLTAQRTCRTWHSIIQESVAIQKALFFIPIQPSSASTKVQNPLLAKLFPGFFTSDTSFLASMDMLQRPEKLEAYIRPEASWRRMLVQQPPIPRIGFLVSCFAFTESYTYHEIPTRPDGLRMEEYFEMFIFGHHVISLEYYVPEIIWWGDTYSSGWIKMKESRGMTVETDIVISIFGGATCTDFEGDGFTEDAVLCSRIQDVYRKLNLQPCAPSAEKKLNEWSYSHWYD